ncbi:MAG: branched-chain amino acid ABC transporter permease [bacterium]|nr:branched-chain amino acid ABC transporter permease [bacterium]
MQNNLSPIRLLGWIAMAAAAIAAPPVLASIYWTSVLSMIVINTLMAASLRTIFLIGEFSLGHVGFMCVGAYTSALLAMNGLPFGIALPAGGLLAGLIAFFLGFPFMRVKGIYFVILTVVTSESLRLLIFNWRSLTGGTNGLIGFPGAGVLSVPGLGQVDFGGFTEYYYLALGIVSLSLLILYRLENSNLGFTWIAIRETDKMAGAVGINVQKYKIINFSIASFFAGVGGALLAHLEQTLSSQASSIFGVMTTIYFLVYVVVGGKERFTGPIIGAIVLSLIMEFTRPMQEYQPMIIGAIAVAVVMIIPEGLVSIPSTVSAWRTKPLSSMSKIDLTGTS